MALVHCIYASAESATFVPEDLSRILETSRRRNGPLGVTGMLLHLPGSFLQILEGPEGVVDRLFARIATDARHQCATRIVREPIAQRAFAEWSMGCPLLGSDAVGEIVDDSDLLRGDDRLTSLDEGRAKKLLTAFSRGRWRIRMTAGTTVPCAV